MKFVATLALAGLCVAGEAQAMPMAPAALSRADRAPIVDAAVVVTKTVRRGPFGGRRVVRRGPMGRTVTTTRVVR